MMQSDYFNWSIAVLLSLFLYGAMFIQRGAQMGMEYPEVKLSPMMIRLTFNPAIINKTAETVPDVPPVIKPVIKKPQAKPVKKIKHKSIAAKKIQPVEKTEVVKKSTAQPQTQTQQVSLSAKKLLQQKRQQYLQKLLSHIESFKFYPRAARRRSIEGDVKISFNLHNDGGYQQLVLDGERSVLVNATRMALEAAMPFPVPAEDLEISRQIEFTMVYSLSQ